MVSRPIVERVPHWKEERAKEAKTVNQIVHQIVSTEMFWVFSKKKADCVKIRLKYSNVFYNTLEKTAANVGAGSASVNIN